MSNIREKSTMRNGCGGCEGLGAHSPRCSTQPGAYWRRLADRAESLGDSIGPNDMAASSAAWGLAARLRARMREEVDQ